MKQAHSSVSLISANLLRPQFLVMHRLQKTWTWILKQLKRICFRCWIIRTTLHLSHPTTSPPFPHHLNNRIAISSLNSKTYSARYTAAVAQGILYLENLQKINLQKPTCRIHRFLLRPSPSRHLHKSVYSSWCDITLGGEMEPIPKDGWVGLKGWGQSIWVTYR